MTRSASAPVSATRRSLLLAGTAMLTLGLPGLAAAARRAAIYPPVPPAYRDAASRLGIPPKILFGVALQESALRWGGHALPWPWTLNIRQRPRRFDSYADALAVLKDALMRGARNVDCGCMQVNWAYHRVRLQSPERALDPWHNLAVGARILADERASRAGWFEAVGAYHAPANAERARRYAQSVFRRIEGIAHA